MSDSKHDEALASFRNVTSADEERARFYMESSNWNLDVALVNYYDDCDHDLRNETDDNDAPPLSTPSDQSSQSTSNLKKPEKKSVIKSTGNVKTLSSLKQDQDSGESSDEEEGQAFYAGGSEHSGQQVLGPPRGRRPDIITDIFRSVRELGAEVAENRASHSRSDQSQIFRGTGYRLGETGSDSEVVTAKKSDNQSQVEVTLKFWKNGFSIDDGPLRPYDGPKSAYFFDRIRHGEIPDELITLSQGREISFNMEDYRHSEYVNTALKTASFSGAGQKLGSVTPTLSSPLPASDDTTSKSESGSGVQPNPVEVDDSKPSTSIQIRLADGSRLVGRFNHHHTIGDIRCFINASSPQSRERGYILLSSFPRKELVNNDDTIEQSGLINSVVMQHLAA